MKFIQGDFCESLAKDGLLLRARRPKLLTCYVLFAGRQEAGEPLVSVRKCQNWPKKVSKDHGEKRNAASECAAAE